MGIYAEYVFPRVMDFALRRPQVARERAELLERAFGEVLEIGFGTGLNLPHYSRKVRRLVGLDPLFTLPGRVARRIAAAGLPVERIQGDAQQLPFVDGAFDCVVTTFTLCTVPNVGWVLAEALRVLKPEGKYLFLEHGRSEDPRLARWQDLLTPLQRILACGCHLNRPIDHLILEAGWRITRLQRYPLPRAPRILAELYRGEATNASFC